MPGYNGTSNSALNVAFGVQSLVTQSALDYAVGDTVQVAYSADTSIFMTGPVTAYNPVTGAMTVNFTGISGYYGLQAIWNTQVWASVGGLLASWVLSLIHGVSASATPVTPTIIVRDLGKGWDSMRGSGLSNFLTDINAVSQIIAQRLKFLQGEWFENRLIGMPFFQSMVGHPITTQAVEMLIQQQILGTPYVTGISAFDLEYGASGRTLLFTATVQTQFGQLTVSNQ